MRVKSDFSARLLGCASAVLLSCLSCFGQQGKTCEVAVAALSLPDGSEGLLHWRVGDAATVPLQLSTRYFSERLKVPVGRIGFHAEPVPEALPTPPEPLVSLGIPADARLAFIVLWAETKADGGIRWRGSLLQGTDWKDSSLRLMNATAEDLGIQAGDERVRLAGGKSMDFPARRWEEAFPVKIFRMQPEMREVFSSTWRVAAGRRELCFIFEKGDALQFRSLLDLAAIRNDDEEDP